MFAALISEGAHVATLTFPDLARVTPLARPLTPRVTALNQRIREAACRHGVTVAEIGHHPVVTDPPACGAPTGSTPALSATSASRPPSPTPSAFPAPTTPGPTPWPRRRHPRPLDGAQSPTNSDGPPPSSAPGSPGASTAVPPAMATPPSARTSSR
ncbi:hypothetical protein GCM10020000_80580 [Streptomyces olivoverticillatus]